MKQKRSPADLLIYLCWAAYSISYVGKVNYAANITRIMDYFAVSKAEAGLAQTFFFFAYGIGQVINGLFCKKYNTKWMVFFSLVSSALLNLVVGITKNFAMVKWLWLVNGFVLSMLWPLLIRTISESVARKSLDRANVIVGAAVACGTLVIYALSSVYAMFTSFQTAFYTATALDLTIAIVWMLSYNTAVRRAREEKDREKAEMTANRQENAGEETMHPRLLPVVIVFLCMFSVGVNLVKDGANTWVPSILKEEFAFNESLAIFLTLFLPLLGIAGTPAAIFIRKKIPDYISSSTVGFVITGIAIGVIMWCLQMKLAVVMLAALLLIGFLSGYLNSMVVSVFPVYMRKMVNSGMISGVLNGFAYLGSTISSYGLGYVADKWGWMTVFTVLLSVCLFVCVCWVFYSVIKRVILNKQPVK